MTLENYRYVITIAWSFEDEEFIGTAEAFPGLSAFGITRQECLKETEVALRLFIESSEKIYED